MEWTVLLLYAESRATFMRAQMFPTSGKRSSEVGLHVALNRNRGDCFELWPVSPKYVVFVPFGVISLGSLITNLPLQQPMSSVGENEGYGH